MVKKVNAHLQKTRKLQSASEAHKRDVYDDLLDDIRGKRRAISGGVKRRNSNVRNNYLSSNSYLL